MPTRRPVLAEMRRAWQRDGADVFALVGLVFLAVGSVLLTVFGWGVPTDWRIDENQVLVGGVVETSETDPTRRIGRRSVQRIGYRYALDGQTYRGELLTVEPGLVAALAPGAEARLEVNARAPDESRLVGQRVALFGPWGLLVGLFPLVGLALVSTAVYLRFRRRASRK